MRRIVFAPAPPPVRRHVLSLCVGRHNSLSMELVCTLVENTADSEQLLVCSFGCCFHCVYDAHDKLGAESLKAGGMTVIQGTVELQLRALWAM